MSDAQDGYDVIPAEFWKSLTEAECYVIGRTGHLEGELLKRYWKFTNQTGPMPEKIQLFIHRDDVQKLADKMQRDIDERETKH